MKTSKLCSELDCDKIKKTQGLCSKHYNRLWYLGKIQQVNATSGAPLEFFNNCIGFEIEDCIGWPYSNHLGYGSLYVDGKEKVVTRLMLERTVGEAPEDKPFALHSCHNPPCFNYRHLRWGSFAENQRDRVENGTDMRGEKCPRAKLKTEEVLRIREDPRQAISIANDYGVSDRTIYSIKNRNTWAWL